MTTHTITLKICIHFKVAISISEKSPSIVHGDPKFDHCRRPTVPDCLNKSPCLWEMVYHTAAKNVAEYLNPWIFPINT